MGFELVQNFAEKVETHHRWPPIVCVQTKKAYELRLQYSVKVENVAHPITKLVNTVFCHVVLYYYLFRAFKRMTSKAILSH